MISALYKLALAALLGVTLTGCGGSSSPAATTPPEPVRSLHTGRTLVVGGNEVFDRDPVTLRRVAHDYGSCVDNEGVVDGDSFAIAGVFNLGILNAYPSRVIIVANAFELTYAERWRTLDNYTSAVLNSSVSGAHVTLVGIRGADQFNAELRNVAAAYGATFVDTFPEVNCK